MTHTIARNIPADMLVRLADEVRAGTVEPAMVAASLAQIMAAMTGVTEALADVTVGEFTMPASRLASAATSDATLLAGRLAALTATISGERL